MPAPTPDYVNDKKMYQMHEDGLSLAAIGKHYLVNGKPMTRERVRQRINRYEESQIYAEIYSLFDHNTKVARVLLRNGVKNIEKLKEVNLDKLRAKKGIGKKTILWIETVKKSLQ